MAMVSDPVGRFHGEIISLEKFDSAEIRPHVKTKSDHAPRDFAVTSSYLRTLAHARTLKTFKNASHFQTIAMIARAMFELAVDIRLLDAVADGPARYSAFMDLERLRVARRIVAFYRSHANAERPDSLEIHEKFVTERAVEIEDRGKKLWPNESDLSKLKHWSSSDLRGRCQTLRAPFDEIYDTEYAEMVGTRIRGWAESARWTRTRISMHAGKHSRSPRDAMSKRWCS